MPKNIIVCADGTGNKGGSTPDSNVYKIYKSVNKHFRGATQDGFAIDEQILFYDNGVGTETNKILRAVGGAFGIGFERNVCDLYKFLARNYNPGKKGKTPAEDVPADRVYFFGFSRGASTVRACNGFIHKCGLAKGHGLHNSELDDLVQEAFEAYKGHKKHPEIAAKFKESDKSYGEIPIHFMGVWDTVVALGFPKRTDVTGLVSAVLNVLFWVAEKGLNLIWPHSFYHYRLTGNVAHAYQALAIDDERTAFWPYVWREQGRENGSVEQVWFAGMHSNVGGGYGRSGMASVALHWMMLRAKAHGLQFGDGDVEKAFADAHVHGRMYNSRDGFGVLYRYHPREIDKLCDGRIEGRIKIHRSVIERINHRTANYAPGRIPAEFEVIESDPKVAPVVRNPGKAADWDAIRTRIDRWVLLRKGLYAMMLVFVLTVLGFACKFWISPPEAVAREGFWGHLADILDYFTPEYFAGLIEVAVVQMPYLFVGAAVLVAIYLWVRERCRRATVAACECLRDRIINE